MQQKTKNAFAVIADDLTGAIDVGAEFHKSGYQVVISNDIQKAKENSVNADILVINTQSREETAEVSYRKTLHALRFLRERGAKQTFLKIDSAFRGNAVTEILALLEEMKQVVLVAPAIPQMKRITVGGYQLFGRTPIERTHYAKDPFHPVTESHIPTLLTNRIGRRVRHVELSRVMKKCASLGLRSAIEEGANIVVADAVSQEDLNHIAESASKLGMLNLTVGSLGLANALIHVLNIQKTMTSTEVAISETSERPVLIVSGTSHPQTVKQIEQAERMLGIPIIDLDVVALCEDYGFQVNKISNVVKDVLLSGGDVLLRSASSLGYVERCLAECENRGISSQKLKSLILRSLGEIVREVYDDSRVSCIVATGGDVCFAICIKLGATALKVVNEIRPAVVHSFLIGGEFDGASLITKGGSVGDKNTLVKILNYLEKLKRT